jgi:hypothetical protein
LAPDGEYRAVLVIYSIDQENESTYESILDYCNNGYNFDELTVNSETNEDRDYYSDVAGKYFAKCNTYAGLLFGSVNNNIVALGMTQYYTYVY